MPSLPDALSLECRGGFGPDGKGASACLRLRWTDLSIV